MRLTVVGCAGSFPRPDSACSAYLLEADGFRLVLDLGNGALGALQQYVALDAVDAVALTHLHADHCIDLTVAYVSRYYRPGGRLPRLPVYGPTGTAGRIAQAYSAHDATQDATHEGRSRGQGQAMERVFDFRRLGGDSTRGIEIGPFRIRTARVNHPVETHALRIEHGGRALVYSGDTGASPALVELARDADVLLCEASFLDGEPNPPDLHLTGRQAAEHAARAGVGRLLLTHLTAWGDEQRTAAEAAAVFADSSVVRPGQVFTV